MQTQPRTLPLRATSEFCGIAIQEIRALSPNGDPFGHQHCWFEALVRPSPGGSASPAAFIEAAYKARRCTETDIEIVNRLAAWLERRSEPTRISINIHPDSLTDSWFVDSAIGHQERAAANSHSICLELVEFGACSNQSTLVDNAQRVRRAGVLIALDDFGSRLNCFDLCAFGIVDLLKIDTRVIGGLGINPHQHAVVHSIQTLAGGLGARVVAEGIETPEQRDALITTGVEYGQGFHFHKPELVEC